MKLIVTLLLLSAAVVSFAAVAKAPEAPAAHTEAPAGPAALGKAPAARDNLSIGHIGQHDRLLHINYVYYQGVPNTVRYENYTYRGTAHNRISAIRVYEVNSIQYATASLVQGGLGHNYATVRVQSDWGRGYYCFLEFYGH